MLLCLYIVYSVLLQNDRIPSPWPARAVTGPARWLTEKAAAWQLLCVCQNVSATLAAEEEGCVAACSGLLLHLYPHTL